MLKHTFLAVCVCACVHVCTCVYMCTCSNMREAALRKDANRLDELVQKAESVVSSKPVTLVEVVEDRMLVKLLAIMDIVSQRLHKTLAMLKSSFSSRLIKPRCLKEEHRQSFLPGANRRYNAHITKHKTHTYHCMLYIIICI